MSEEEEAKSCLFKVCGRKVLCLHYIGESLVV